MAMTWTDELLAAADTDAAYERHLQASIAVADDAPRAGDAVWRPLVVGYCGGGNLGADLRTAETVRHLRHLVPDCRPRVTLMGEPLPFPALAPHERIGMDMYPPLFVKDHVANQDAVIIAEGSLFTSTFADDLSMFFIAALAQRERNGRPGIAYGVEVDRMSARLLAFAQKNIGDGTIFVRNAASLHNLAGHGMRGALGADTAWTWDAGPCARAAALLADLGGRAARPCFAFCPVNPFWWPVRLDRKKFSATVADGTYRDVQFAGAYFHDFERHARERYECFVGQCAAYLDWARRCLDMVPLMIAMDRADTRVCADINARLGRPVACLHAPEQRPETIAALLAGARFAVANRFHAAVLALLGQVPCLGIAMDGRLRGLFHDMDLDAMLLAPDAPDLARRLEAATLHVLDRHDAIVHGIRGGRYRQLRRLGEMGRGLVRRLRQPGGARGTIDPDLHWQRYLPPLGAPAAALVADFAGAGAGGRSA